MKKPDAETRLSNLEKKINNLDLSILKTYGAELTALKRNNLTLKAENENLTAKVNTLNSKIKTAKKKLEKDEMDIEISVSRGNGYNERLDETAKIDINFDLRDGEKVFSLLKQFATFVTDNLAKYNEQNKS